MNIFCAILLLVTLGYAAYLFVSAFRSMRSVVASQSPSELLNAVVAARRHYGFQLTACLVSSAVIACLKGVLFLVGAYANPGMFTRLAFGDKGDDIISAFGLVGVSLIAISIVQAVLFIRYDAYLRMIFALRKYLNLDLKISAKEAEHARQP